MAHRFSANTITVWGKELAPTNATIIRKAYDDFAKGDIPAVLETFDPAITWQVPGHGPLSGDYKGHEEVVGFFQRTLALCGGIFAPRCMFLPTMT